MSRVLLTGASGYVGTRLTHALSTATDYEVKCLPPGVDIRDRAALHHYYSPTYDYVIHLAARTGVRQSLSMPDTYWATNVEGFQNVLDLTAACRARLLYASSSNAYEWHLNPYATTKRVNEFQAQVAADRVCSVGLRFHTIYPGRPDMLFARMYAGQVRFVNSDCYRDYIHVADVCAAIACVLRNFNTVVCMNRAPVLDVGTGHATSVKALATDVFGFSGEWRAGQPAGERKTTQADITALLALGWSPTCNVLDATTHGDTVGDTV